MKIASIDVDAQQTFTPLCPNELPVNEGNLIANELNEQAIFANFRIMTKDAHSKNALWVVGNSQDMLKPLPFANANLTWLRHAEVGSPGFELIPNLPNPEDYDFLVYKGIEKNLHPYGACFHDLDEKISTGLIEWLIVKNISVIIVGGLATDYCVKNTVLQLLKNGTWKVILNLGACRGIDPQTTASSIDEIKKAGGIVIQTSKELKSILKG